MRDRRAACGSPARRAVCARLAERARRRHARPRCVRPAPHGRAVPDAAGGAGERQPRRQLDGPVHADRGVVDDLGAGVAREVERRRVADAHEHEVAGDPFRLAPGLPSPHDVCDRHALDVARPFGIDERRPRDDAHAARARGRSAGMVRGSASRSTIGRHLDAGVEQVERRLVAEAVGGRDDGARAGLHAVEPHQPLRRVGEHDARPVVVGEHQRLIEGAGRDDRLLGADLVEALAEIAGDQLSAKRPVTVVPVRIRQVLVAARLARRDRRAARSARARSDAAAPVEERAAELRPFVDEQRVGAGFSRGDRRLEARRPRAHDEHVGEQIGLVVVLVLAPWDRAAEAGEPADRLLEEAPGAAAAGRTSCSRSRPAESARTAEHRIADRGRASPAG